MLKRICILVWIISLGLSAYAQAPKADPQQYANFIRPESLKDHLSIIASDALEGRATGSRGQKMAAAFIRHHFEQLGLQGPVNGSYYQPVMFYSSVPGEIYIKAGGTRFDNFTDLIYSGSHDSGGEQKATVVFAGKGADADLAQVDIKGKAVMVLAESLDFSAMRSWRGTTEKLYKQGAALVVFTVSESADKFSAFAGQMKLFMGRGSLGLRKPEGAHAGTLIVSRAAAEKIMGQSFERLTKAAAEPATKAALRKMKPGSLHYQTQLSVRTVPSENVLGYLEGTDKKEELIVITAHYDHIGKTNGTSGDVINNGADDDGSGTVAVMEMATAFAQAKKDGNGPRRSILFMTVTGEEIGLLGSQYYTENPVFPLANTVMNLNIDMIGRNDPEHTGKPPYVYVIGSDKLSSELHEINERNNATYTQLAFDYTYNDENHPTNLYKRSDHWNFAKLGIPIVFFFDGIHEDYHKVTDEVSKIEFDLLTLRTKAAFFTAWEVANRENRLVVDKK